MALTKSEFDRIALQFPGAHEKLSHGDPSIFIEKRFFTRLRGEDDSIVLIVDSIDERDMLLAADPETYFITSHYKNYPAILARMSKIDKAMLHARLARHWRRIASKRLQKATASRLFS